MFEMFTDESRRAVVLAQEEARRLNHAYIGSEHVLLGLLRVSDGNAAAALGRVGVSLDVVRQQLDRGVDEPGPHLPFTPAAKKCLELAMAHAQQREDEHVGTEHLLLGLLDQEVPALVALNVDPDRVREQLNDLLR